VIAAALATVIGSAEDLTDLERGKQLAAMLRSAQPNQSVTNNATLTVRDADARRQSTPITIETQVVPAGWLVRYRSTKAGYPTALAVYHDAGTPPRYEWTAGGKTTALEGAEIWRPFLDSDFWLFDLSMEFLHWPQQRLVKQELSNGRLCDILESTNPTTNGYATVRSSVDVEQKAILSAEAFDSRKVRIKYFSIQGSIELRGTTIAGLNMVDERKGSVSKLIPDGMGK
jgi:hypothetical protein